LAALTGYPNGLRRLYIQAFGVDLGRRAKPAKAKLGPGLAPPIVLSEALGLNMPFYGCQIFPSADEARISLERTLSLQPDNDRATRMPIDLPAAQP
jgi:hypothetical protein